jgi:hypothetical protein
VREIAANSRPVHKRPLSGRLGIAHARDIIDVAMYPFQDCHDPGDAVAGAGKLSLRKSHELVGWTKAAREQER